MNLNIFKLRSIKTRVTLFTLVIFLICIWSLALYASALLREDMKRLLGEEQYSTASYMAAEVDDEMDDRLRALEKIAKTVTPSLIGNPVALQTFLERLPVFQDLFNGGTFITKRDGRAIASLPYAANRIGINYMDRDFIAAAINEGITTIGRPVIDKVLKSPIFVMSAPIRDEQGKVIGALSGVTNLSLRNFLDTVTGNRYGKTGGYLIVSPKHRLIVTASDKSRILEESPKSGLYPLVDSFIGGYEGSGIGVNPRGVEVLASAKLIPAVGWYVNVSLPTAEAFAPIYSLQDRLIIATAVLTLLAGILTWWMLKRQLSPIFSTIDLLSALPEKRQHPLPLPIVNQDEIGDLIGSFNRLLEILKKRETKLSISEEMLKRTGEMAKVGGWELDVDSGEIFWSAETCRILEFEPPVRPTLDEQINMFAPDAQAVFKASLHAGIENGTPWDLELSANTSRGRSIWLRTQGYALKETDKPIKLIGAFQDITGRRHAEDELRIAAIAFATQNGMLITDADGLIQRVNPAFTRVTGYPASEAIGRTPALLQSGRHEKGFFEQMWNSLKHEGFWQGEIWNRRKNGEIYPEMLIITRIVSERGETTHYVGNFSDISALKESEQKQQQLSEQISRYADEIADLYENAPCGYHSIDKNGVFQHINRTELKWLGYSWDEIVGKLSMFDILTADSQQTFQRAFRYFMDSGEVRDVEMEMIRKDGSTLHVLNSAVAVYDTNGNYVTSRSTVYDMTERKKMERERSDNLQRLAEVSHHLVAAQEEARRLLSRELHDRTSPNLAAININLNMIAADMAAAHSIEFAERLEDTRALIDDTAESIRGICADMRPPLLDYAGLAAALESYVHQFSRRTGIKVKFKCDNRETRCAPELESLLFRICQEALTNCAKHASAESANVTLNCGNHVELTIADNGLGFDIAQLGKDGSIGLGILNMREMAEVAGGTFTLTSAPTQGTSVRVTINQLDQ
ncbi:MAG: PAS domain-containing protein [Gallionella sp.]